MLVDDPHYSQFHHIILHYLYLQQHKKLKQSNIPVARVDRGKSGPVDLSKRTVYSGPIYDRQEVSSNLYAAC